MDPQLDRVFHSRISFILVGAVTLLSTAWVAAQEESEEKTYRIEGYIYRVDGAMEGIEEDVDSVWQIDESATRLGQDVHIVAEDVHLQDIADLIEDQYNVRVLIDMNVVQPRTGAFDDSPEGEDVSYLSDGIVPFVNLRDIALREALHALLEPMGLEFRMVRGEYIWISSPENVGDGRFNDFRAELHKKGILFRDSGSIYLMERQPLLLGGERDIPTPRRKQLERFDSVNTASRIQTEAESGQALKIPLNYRKTIGYLETVSRENDLRQVRVKSEDVHVGPTVTFVFRERDHQPEMDVDVESTIIGSPEELPEGAVYLEKPEPVSVRHEIRNQRIPLGRWFAVLIDGEDHSLRAILMKVQTTIPTDKIVNLKTTQLRNVAVPGSLLEYRGSIDPTHLESAVRVDASGTLDDAAYFVPIEEEFGEWIQALGTPEYEPWILSSQHVTMLVDGKRWIEINEALSMTNTMAGGNTHEPHSVLTSRVIRNEHWIRLEEALQRSVQPGETGVIDPNQLRGRGAIAPRIDFDTRDLDQKESPLTRKGDMAAAYQVDSHADNGKYRVWVGFQCHLAGRNDLDNGDARYVQVEFEADVLKGQPYALVMPMAEREYLLYAMTFRPIPLRGERRYASADVSVKALHVVGDRSRSKDRVTGLVRPREALENDVLPGFTSIRKMELMSAPRTTTKAHWDDDSPGASTLFKVVITNNAQRGGGFGGGSTPGGGGFGGGGAPGGSGLTNIEDIITSFAPPEHDAPVEMEDLVHSVLLLDVDEEDIEYRPHTQSPARNIERMSTKVGTLAQLRAEESNGEDLRISFTYAARWNRLDGPKRIIGKESAEAQQLYAMTMGGVMLGPDEVSVTILPLGHDEYAVFLCEVTPIEE